MLDDKETSALRVPDPTTETKILRSWLIRNRITHAQRTVHEQPVRWRPEVGRLPLPHEVQWDEDVYRLHVELVAPEVIDGELTAVLNEPPPVWDKKDAVEMTPEKWMAQEIFRRAGKIVPPRSYGPDVGGMQAKCLENKVYITLPTLGVFCISVE